MQLNQGRLLFWYTWIHFIKKHLMLALTFDPIVCMHAKSLQSCLTLCNSTDCSLPELSICPWNSPDKNTGVGCHALLQRIFPTQRSSPSLLSLLNWQAGSWPLVPLGKPLILLHKQNCVLTFLKSCYQSYISFIKLFGNFSNKFSILFSLTSTFYNN